MASSETSAPSPPKISPRLIRPRFVWLLCGGLAALLALSFLILLIGHHYGHSIALSGHSEDESLAAIQIEDAVLAVPRNMIRLPEQRMDGHVQALSLYMDAAEMRGYREARRDAFNLRAGGGEIVFARIEPALMSRDMSGRFEPIYSTMVEENAKPGPSGITFYRLGENSGYDNEMLAVAKRGTEAPFVARCLADNSDRSLTASCERDVHLTDTLSLTYRFSPEKLADWQRLDRELIRTVTAMLR